jgi:HPt (histidine-containing phosphotransfer) domain-containing protein
LAEKRSAMRKRINQLAGKFLQRCAQEMVTAREAVARLGTGDANALRELQHLAHRICGTGASLGFEPLSACASAIERLAEAQTNCTTPDQKSIERLVEYIALLETEIERLDKARCWEFPRAM